MGYVLSLIFGIASAWVVLLLFCVMVAFAVRIVRGNVSEKSIPFVFPSFVTMLLVYAVVTGIVSGLIVGVRPFWHP